MRSGLNEGYEKGATVPTSQSMPHSIASTTAGKEIPYDYVARFKLQGTSPGNRVQDVINISTDGTFVAVAIGYSFIPAALPPPIPVIDIAALSAPSGNDGLSWLITNGLMPVLQDPRLLAQCLLVRVCGIDFKYSIVDSGTGRELQNQPIHNIAGLGEANGERPFRPLAKPMMFVPRSTIRIEVEEISRGPIYAGAELFIVLHGYKMLGFGMSSP